MTDDQRDHIKIAKHALSVAMQAIPITPEYSSASSDLLRVFQLLNDRERQINESIRAATDASGKGV